jgi:transposase
MKFVGVDLHKQTITVTVVDAARKRLSRRRFSNLQTDKMSEFFRELGPFAVTVEATAGYEWFVQLVEPVAQRVVLAHPGKLKVITQSTRKTDKIDSLVLAEMLALDQIPAAYRPTPRQREYRQLVRQRTYLQRRATAVRNKIRHVLANYNKDRKDLFTEVGQEYLAGLSLLPSDRFTIDQLTALRSFVVGQREAVDRQLREFSQGGSPQEQADHARLKTIPGVGDVTADVILAELADPRRFPSIKDVVAYAGLAPGQRESAGKRKNLSIEKTGSPLLRWVLIQAGWQLVQRSKYWSSIHEALKARTGSKKAIVAVSRRLLGMAYSLLKREQDYCERRTAKRDAAPVASSPILAGSHT